MKQLLVTGPRQASLCDVPCPPCGAAEALVETRLTAISTGTELRVFRAIAVDDEGQFLHETVPFQLPAPNGYSLVGTVREAGDAVTGVRPGERVFATAPHAAWAAVPFDALQLLPESVAAEHAVWLNVLEVAHRGLRQAQPDPGADVAIIGQGVVGLGMLAWSVACGFRTVVVEHQPERLAIAREMGADLALSPDEADCVAEVVAFTGGVGADVVFEAGSSWEAIRVALQVARADGKVVVMSRHTQRPDFNPVGHPYLGKRLNVMTTYGYPPDGHRWDRHRSVALTLDFLERGRFHLDPMVTGRFPADELPAVYDRMDRGDASLVGVLIDW
ncbi:MAG: zinc-binding alcohol dehydrogenase [Planctomycetota bacterium]|nr:zinc-binding alcohol dehydrogenase [Planctomycetota bacterium]